MSGPLQVTLDWSSRCPYRLLSSRGRSNHAFALSRSMSLSFVINKHVARMSCPMPMHIRAYDDMTYACICVFFALSLALSLSLSLSLSLFLFVCAHACLQTCVKLLFERICILACCMIYTHRYGIYRYIYTGVHIYTYIYIFIFAFIFVFIFIFIWYPRPPKIYGFLACLSVRERAHPQHIFNL